MKVQEILEKILANFKAKGVAQVSGYNQFGFIRETAKSVYVSREDGKDTPISHKRLLIGINAYLKRPSLYNGTPTDLRAFGITHVTSPIFALLHILSQDDYK